jgi:hypothetical protein
MSAGKIVPPENYAMKMGADLMKKSTAEQFR